MTSKQVREWTGTADWTFQHFTRQNWSIPQRSHEESEILSSKTVKNVI